MIMNSTHQFKNGDVVINTNRSSFGLPLGMDTEKEVTPSNRLVVIDQDYLHFDEEEWGYVTCMCYFCEGYPEMVGEIFHINTQRLVRAP